MKPIDYSFQLTGRQEKKKITVSLRGGVCGEITPLLAKHEFFDALDLLLSAKPDDYDSIQPDKYTLVVGRKDERGTLADW